MLGIKATNGLSALIFSKSLRVSPCTNKQFDLTQIVNFVQVDAFKMQFLTGQAPMIIRLPFVISICFIVLFAYLGLSFLSGILIFVVTFATNFLLSRLQARLQKEFMRLQDSRVRSISEALANIKIIKMNVWTHVFQKLISERRALELAVLWRRMCVSQLLITNLYFFPQILQAVVFAFYVGFGNELRLDIAFTVIALMGLIKDPLRAVPLFMGQLIEFRASMRRIQDYLLIEEINYSIVTEARVDPQDSILIRDGSAFHYGASNADIASRSRELDELGSRRGPQTSQEQTMIQRSASFTSLYMPVSLNERKTDSTQKALTDFLSLKQIGLRVKRGQLVCVIGDVGSGKTSLLNCLTNNMLFTDSLFYQQNCHQTIEDIKDQLLENSKKEIPQFRSPVVLSESLALVQQNPWIQNKSIRDNILFGAAFDSVKYAEIIQICQLKKDFEELPAGDHTVIGDKSINLSSGQRAKISLSRAVYSNKECFLMDDPLGALEARVRHRIFKAVLLRKLADKTRVFVTQELAFLHHADAIVCLKDGAVAF